MPQEPWHPGNGAKPDCVIQSTVGKSAPMQVIKQPEHGEIQQPRNKIDPPSRQTMINN